MVDFLLGLTTGLILGGLSVAGTCLTGAYSIIKDYEHKHNIKINTKEK